MTMSDVGLFFWISVRTAKSTRGEKNEAAFKHIGAHTAELRGADEKGEEVALEEDDVEKGVESVPVDKRGSRVVLVHVEHEAHVLVEVRVVVQVRKEVHEEEALEPVGLELGDLANEGHHRRVGQVQHGCNQGPPLGGRELEIAGVDVAGVTKAGGGIGGVSNLCDCAVQDRISGQLELGDRKQDIKTNVQEELENVHWFACPSQRRACMYRVRWPVRPRGCC